MSVRAVSVALALLALSGGALGATHVVKVEGMTFQPASLTVMRGDTVVWVNNDVVPHTVTAAGKFDSRNIEAGRRWTWTATAGGRFDYVCSYHPGMKGRVEVK
jgi:plastocyanin